MALALQAWGRWALWGPKLSPGGPKNQREDSFHKMTEFCDWNLLYPFLLLRRKLGPWEVK